MLTAPINMQDFSKLKKPRTFVEQVQRLTKGEESKTQHLNNFWSLFCFCESLKSIISFIDKKIDIISLYYISILRNYSDAL